MMLKKWLTIVLLMAVSLSFGIVTGKLKGIVKDNYGNMLESANVSVLFNGKSISVAQSQGKGEYELLNIPPGQYKVRFSLARHKTAVFDSVKIEPGVTTHLDAILSESYLYQQTAQFNLGNSQYGASTDSNNNTPAPGQVNSGGNQVNGVSATNVADIVALQSGTSFSGGELHVRGARANEMVFDADGCSVSDPVSGGGALMADTDILRMIEHNRFWRGNLYTRPRWSKPKVYDVYIPPIIVPEWKYYAEYKRLPVRNDEPWRKQYNQYYDPNPPKPKAPPQPPKPVQYRNETYTQVVENAFKNPVYEPLSTFSIDVDTACYSNIRRLINEGALPERNYVRIEELLNYFDYEYPQPVDEHPFSIITELGVCPWESNHQLLHIGIKGKEVDIREAPTSNLVFLLDVSGSMGYENKLSLVKEAMKLLVRQLRPQDMVSIVTYASSSAVALQATSGADKGIILNAIEQLYAGGSTAGSSGLNLAYKIAAMHRIESGNNRIILCTDGDFNTGPSSDAEMEQLITDKRSQSIFLTVLGFGVGNIKDSKMELMADKGNGNYAYVDNLVEAHKVLVNEMYGTLLTIAKDVKLQLEFNPAVVKEYRLIGYENRKLSNQDFNDDFKDAGEMGAGQSVTAIYELIPIGAKGSADAVDSLKYPGSKLTEEAKTRKEVLTVKLRYKKPDSNTSIRLVREIPNEAIPLSECSNDFRFSAAVAGYGMLLKNSIYTGNLEWDNLIDLAYGAIGKDRDGYRREFVSLSEQARDLMQGKVQRYKY